MSQKGSPNRTHASDHREWLGFVRPVGLVVSGAALAEAGCTPPRTVAREQSALSALLAAAAPESFPAFAEDVLGWERAALEAPGEDLAAALPDGGLLSPAFAVRASSGVTGIVCVVAHATDFDEPAKNGPFRGSPEAGVERLLRDRGIPFGLLWNGEALRLVHAPRGESAGHATFVLASMADPAGQPILAALLMLLSAARLPALPALLAASRKHQGLVSTRLREQVLSALGELLAGFEAADVASGSTRFVEEAKREPEHVYGGLLTTVLRLLFLLYAEDRGLFPDDPMFVQGYSVTGLYERLREEAAVHGPALAERYGAWARLITVFRLVHDGGGHASMRLPPRRGRLFDPDAFPFLEGRARGSVRDGRRLPGLPRLSDATVHRVLERLLLLDGERLSYRALDVEQLGSVYEGMMGFGIEVVTEPSIAVRPHHVVVGLASLLALPGARRAARLEELADVRLGERRARGVERAKGVGELVLALGKSVSPRTPEVLAPGAMTLQPGEERRRSGSHYTPRALTEPMVETTLRPLLERLGPRPSSDGILGLRVCDPAMGSGAFLVAACRALADALVAAWDREGTPAPPGEEALLAARRLVARRCLYGVDKNPFAVDLAKLSLWLVTLAKDHAFTFLDHSLRQGDALVGLSRAQIAAFDWAPADRIPALEAAIQEGTRRARSARTRLRDLGDDASPLEREALHREAEDALGPLRRAGNAVIDAFFAGTTDKERRENLARRRALVEAEGIEGLGEGQGSSERTPFHWEIEFPEVFDEGEASG